MTTSTVPAAHATMPSTDVATLGNLLSVHEQSVQSSQSPNAEVLLSLIERMRVCR